MRERIESTYARLGFDSIDPTDLHGRFRWWGLYTQRKPGIDGGKTATLEPEELEDKYFMLRVRIDGGQLSTEQLRVIGGISNEFARGLGRPDRSAEHPAALDPRRGRPGDLAPPRKSSDSARPKPAVTCPASSSALRSRASPPTN